MIHSPNRIGASCWFCRFDYKTKSTEDWELGRLLAWSTDHEENDGEYGPFPVGVVESLANGMCHAVSVTRICFGENPGQEADCLEVLKRVPWRAKFPVRFLAQVCGRDTGLLATKLRSIADAIDRGAGVAVGGGVDLLAEWTIEKRGSRGGPGKGGDEPQTLCE